MNKGCRELAPTFPQGPPLHLVAPALPQQSLLGHRSDQRAVAGEDQTARKAARVGKARAVLGVEQPFVGAERAVEPQRVVEAPPPPPPPPPPAPSSGARAGGRPQARDSGGAH